MSLLGFSEPRKKRQGVPKRYLYFWGIKISNSRRFREIIKTPERGVFFICNVPKAHIAPKAHRFCRQAKHRIIAFQGVPSGRLPRYARNDNKCVARKITRKMQIYSRRFWNNRLISTKFVSAKICGYFCFFEKCFEKGGSFLNITLIFGLISFIFCIRLTDWVFNYIIFE